MKISNPIDKQAMKKSNHNFHVLQNIFKDSGAFTLKKDWDVNFTEREKKNFVSGNGHQENGFAIIKNTIISNAANLPSV